jgi:hypothetical protein
MQGFDHQLVAIHQADIQAEARRQRLAAARPYEVPVGPVGSKTTSVHHGWRGVLAHLAPSRLAVHGQHS